MTIPIVNFDHLFYHYVICCIFSPSDLTVEHAQLLLLLFHGLPVMLKKSLLLKLGQCILDVAETVEDRLEAICTI